MSISDESKTWHWSPERIAGIVAFMESELGSDPEVDKVGVVISKVNSGNTRFS